jgi:hypothetical protein
VRRRCAARVRYCNVETTVLALRANDQWTVAAPKSAYAPIVLRGYRFGEYLGQYMSSVEAEERLHLAARWTATLFVGVGCLYGGSLSCTDSENVYPDAGAGVQYRVFGSNVPAAETYHLVWRERLEQCRRPRLVISLAGLVAQHSANACSLQGCGW